MRNQLIHLSILLFLFSAGCKSQPKATESKAEGTSSIEKKTIEKLYNPNLSVIADNYILKDSASFYKLADYIIENAEINTTKQHAITGGYISHKVYKLVYETPDDKISLNRKLDILSLMFFYHYHSANEYNSKVSGEIRKGNQQVISRPVLLVPVLNAVYWSEPVLYTITAHETIVLPKSYVSTMNKTLLELNELLNFRKANKYHFTSPINHLFDKQFSSRYPQHHR